MKSLPAQPIETLIYEGPEVDQRLRELGLSAEGMTEVVLRGEHARAEATDNDPRTAAGLDAYRYRVRALRDIYMPSGWIKHVENGVEMIVSADGQTAVVTRSGDAGTGLRSGQPQPNSKVGESTEIAVNDRQLLLLDPEWLEARPLEGRPKARPMERPETNIFMLLVHRDGDMVHSELSLPSGVDDTGAVINWLERVLLPVLDMSAEPVLSGTSDENVDTEIDVPVIRKR